MAQLNAELTINLGMVLDWATHHSYSSALNSYLTFCQLHDLDIKPVQQTLALFITFQSTHINLKSVDMYLSSIANQLESHFPDVQAACKSPLISCALQGAKWHYSVPTSCKLPLTSTNILTIFNTHSPTLTHDLLFTVQIATGMDCLMQLSELTLPDSVPLHDYCKVSMCHLVEFLPQGISFWLPGHKSNKFFEGNHLIIHKGGSPDIYVHFSSYHASCDTQFPLCPELWLWADGTLPTQMWFISQLCHFFPSSITGQSMHAGGATALAEAGITPNLIQTAGHWTSDTFTCYVWKKSFLIWSSPHWLLLFTFIVCLSPLDLSYQAKIFSLFLSLSDSYYL